MEPNTDLAISQWIENLPDTHPCLLYDSESIMPKRAKRGQKSGTSPSTLKSQKTHDTNDPDSATDATSRVDRAVQFVEDPLPLLSLTQSPLRGRGSTSLVTSRASSVDKSSSQEDDWYRLSNCDPPVNYLNVPQKVTFQPALDLLATLKDGSQKKDDCDQESLEKICLAARLLLHQHYVEEYWSSRVVIPLLGLATEPYGLLATSLTSLPLAKVYLPQYQDCIGNNISLDRKIDYAVVLPRMIFENQDAPADEELDLLHQHTPLNPYINAACNRCLLGMGLELKDANGRRVDAETQVAVWCTAYFNWMRKHRKGNARLPPLVACVMIGHLFDFYIAYAIEDPQDFRVVMWGPQRDLRGLLDTTDGIERVLRTLQALMEHLKSSFIEDMRKVLGR